jgi:hypothetical protein
VSAVLFLRFRLGFEKYFCALFFDFISRRRISFSCDFWVRRPSRRFLFPASAGARPGSGFSLKFFGHRACQGLRFLFLLCALSFLHQPKFFVAASSCSVWGQSRSTEHAGEDRVFSSTHKLPRSRLRFGFTCSRQEAPPALDFYFTVFPC